MGLSEILQELYWTLADCWRCADLGGHLAACWRCADLGGHLAAWWEVVCGRVTPDSRVGG